MFSCVFFYFFFFFFKQKTAYEMRISDWSSDGCSSDLWWDRSAATDPGRGDTRALTCTVAEVDVQTGQRLQIARVLERTRIDHAKADALSERLRRALGALGIRGHEHRQDRKSTRLNSRH